MLITCWSVTGGSGTTVVACALAAVLADASPHGALLVDLAGDVPLALGLAVPDGPGVAEWLEPARSVGLESLEALAVPATAHLTVVPRGVAPLDPSSRWDALTATLAARTGVTVVDGGGAPPPALTQRSDHALLVVRCCFLASERARRSALRPSGVVVVREAGRLITPRDIESRIGAPVRAVIDWDPAIARAVDAGLLVAGFPSTLTRPLRSIS